jgi:hypothetical protein
MAEKPMSDDIISELTKKMLSYFNTKDTNKKNAKKRVTKAQKEALSGASAKRKKRLAKQQKDVKGQGQSNKKGLMLTRVRIGPKRDTLKLTSGQNKVVPSKDNLEDRKAALAKKMSKLPKKRPKSITAMSIIKKDTNIGNKKKKAPIVTKEQLKKSGLSLRDYMNFLKSQKTGRTITRDSRFDKKKKAKGANT